jgi:hypothetical protein
MRACYIAPTSDGSHAPDDGVVCTITSTPACTAASTCAPLATVEQVRLWFRIVASVHGRP